MEHGVIGGYLLVRNLNLNLTGHSVLMKGFIK